MDVTRTPKKIAAAFSYAWRFLKSMVHKGEEQHIFLMSGGLAFSLVFCIIPLGLIAFSLLGLVFEKTALAAEIGQFIDRAVPHQQFADSLKSVVFARAEEFRVYKGMAGLIGMLGLLLAASGLFSSMRTVLNAIFHASGGSRLYKEKFRDLGIVLLVLLYFVLSIGVVPLIDVALAMASKLKALEWLDLKLAQRYLVHLVTVALILGGYVTLYLAVPQRRQPMRVVMIAGLSATILWFLAKEAFGLYVLHAASLKKIYGAYVVAVMLGLWIYYTSLVFIVGAMIGQVYKELREAQSIEADAS
ncbi:MAG: YihY/virulence factor BrkB family protein [bacterium]|nr:YihY/virulence factor BrkB family protein [bacterium]